MISGGLTLRSDTPESERRPEMEPWEQPIPLAESGPIESWPNEVVPKPLADFVFNTAGAISCPHDYVGVPFLGLAGAAIGARRGWRERPALYTAIVGPPGSAKTPALRTVGSP